MSWDYFISHASEDKQLVVAPFAHYLRAARFAVWYDEFTLTVGDSLLQSISRGLSTSRFGVVFLSPAFFAKRWPQQELNGLFALEGGGEKRILPIWHQVSAADIVQTSPILADRVAVNTVKGLQYVAERIVNASYPDRVKDLPLTSAGNTSETAAKTARDAFRKLLDSGPSIEDVSLFLSGYPILLNKVSGYAPALIPSFKLPNPIRFDFAQLSPHGMSGPVEVKFVCLGPVDPEPRYSERFVNELVRDLGPRTTLKRRPANDYLGSPYFGELPRIGHLANAIRELVPSHNIHWDAPDTWSLHFTVLAGRRGTRGGEEEPSPVSGSGLRIDFASYDRLLDSREDIYGGRAT